jgi:hypothetical protein
VLFRKLVAEEDPDPDADEDQAERKKGNLDGTQLFHLVQARRGSLV